VKEWGEGGGQLAVPQPTTALWHMCASQGSWHAGLVGL
jgi:hypothetical protein